MTLPISSLPPHGAVDVLNPWPIGQIFYGKRTNNYDSAATALS